MASTNTSPFEPTNPAISVETAGLGPIPTQTPGTQAESLYPGEVPEPRGTNSAEKARIQEGESTDPTAGTGVEGEVDVWQSRYSQRNFIGRIGFRIVLTLGWLALAVYTWGMNHPNLYLVAWSGLAIVGLLWVALGIRMIQAYYSHFYRLTNRRLFVSTGVFNRRRDMMELLRVKDVFTRQQSLMDRWLGLGTVVVVPNEKELPTFYLAGVDDPKKVMDLVWHQARSERDLRSIKVEDI
jgi:membrane protein YdbS with pleckstrin-like domain